VDQPKIRTVAARSIRRPIVILASKKIFELMVEQGRAHPKAHTIFEATTICAFFSLDGLVKLT
jgi:hypothetical protein